MNCKIMTFKEIDIFINKLHNYISNGDCIALIGDLGSGKTTFSQKLIKKFGINAHVKSPTFNYVFSYSKNNLVINHFDVYRIQNSEDIYEIGYEDFIFDKNAINIIEWANNILEELPEKYINIKLSIIDESSRRICINFVKDKFREKEFLNYAGFRN